MKIPQAGSTSKMMLVFQNEDGTSTCFWSERIILTQVALTLRTSNPRLEGSLSVYTHDLRIVKGWQEPTEGKQLPSPKKMLEGP